MSGHRQNVGLLLSPEVGKYDYFILIYKIFIDIVIEKRCKNKTSQYSISKA